MQKPFEAMTSDEKINNLKWMADELMGRTARFNDELGYLRNEIMFWRRLYAIKEGLSNEQMDRLFGNTNMGGLMPRGY